MSESWTDLFKYIQKYLRTYCIQTIQTLNRHLLPTTPQIHDCARCDDCGRNVHDFTVPDKVWREVTGSTSGILCYDCFCTRSDKKFGVKRRIKFEGEVIEA